MNEWLNWEECEAGIVLPECGGGRADSFIFSTTVRTEMFVTALGCRAARKLNEPKCTKQGRESKPTLAVGGADGVKQIDSYRYYDTDAAANTEWYTFLMLISARQMSERAPARKLENEQKASQPANAPPAVMRHKTHGWQLSCCCHGFPLIQNVKQTRSNLTY